MKRHHTARTALPALVTGACLALLFTTPASGGLCLWSGLGNDGRFSNQLNWAPDPVPGALDRAAFEVGGALDVLFPVSAVNLDLLVLDGAITFRTDPQSLMRRNYSVEGDAFVEGGALSIGGIGLLVANHLFVDDGGALTVAYDQVGPFGRGLVDVGGALIVGAFDTGTVTLEQCGTLRSEHAFVAEWPGSVATIRLDETGSVWLVGSDTFLADYGDALLEIRNGGSALFGASLGLANQPGSIATAVVEGPGSVLSVWDELSVGRGGDGTVVVSDGAELWSGDADVGLLLGTGSIVVDGPGSRWLGGVDTRIGRAGTGALTVCDGGTAEMAHARLGDADGSTGSAFVSCPGARWSLSDALWVGRRGAGGLTVADGGRVTSRYAAIGREGPGTGAVTVLGTGAQWEIDETLAIGGSPTSAGGVGTLTILGDGAVEVGSTLRLWPGGSVLVAGGTLAAPHVDHTWNGAFSFTGGRLHTDVFEGDLWNAGGTMAPGRSIGQSAMDDWDWPAATACIDPDWLTGQAVVTGWYCQTAGALEIELLSTAGRTNDRLVVESDAFVDGELVVRLIGGFEPDPLDVFVILEADSLVGEFDNAPITVPLGGGGWFNVIYDRTPGAAQVRLTGFVPPPPCPTDLDGDGRTGFSDLAMLLVDWGTCPSCHVDLDGDGLVGMEDLTVLMRGWGDCP